MPDNPQKPPIDEPVTQPTPAPNFAGTSDTTDTPGDSSADQQATSEETGLKLAEESDNLLSLTGRSGDSRDRALEPFETESLRVENLQSPASVEMTEQLRSVFSRVDLAMLDTRLVQDVQTIIAQQSGRKFLSGSDTQGGAGEDPLTGRTAVQKFRGFTMTGPDGEATTKVYENGNVVTKFADGTQMRFRKDGGAEISVDGNPPRSVSREEANLPIATASGDGFNATQNADGTLKIEFTGAQPDGAISMTLHPPGPDGLKWTRTIPARDGIPAQTISAYADGNKQVDFAQPISGLETAFSTKGGEILVAPASGGQAPKTEAPHSDAPEAETPTGIVLELPAAVSEVSTTPQSLSLHRPETRAAFVHRLDGSSDPALELATANGAQSDSSMFIRGRGELRLPGNTERPVSIPERMASTVPYLLNPNSVFSTSLNPFEIASTPIFGRANGFDSTDPLSRFLGRDSQRSPFDLPHLQPIAREPEPQWLAAGEAVRKMSQATNAFEAASALEELSKLADRGNPHAQTALAATILALTGGEPGLRQVQEMNFRGNPVFSPDLSRLSEQERALLMSSAMLKFSSNLRLYELPDLGAEQRQTVIGQFRIPGMEVRETPMSTEALACLATAFSAASASGKTEDAARIAAVLKGYSNTDSGTGALWNVLHGREGQQNPDLQRLFLSGLHDDTRSQLYMDTMTRRAVEEGSKPDIDLLVAALTNADTTAANSDRAFAALRRAAENGHADAVYDALSKSQTEHGDHNKLLDCLGAIASDGNFNDQKIQDVMAVLRDGMGSEDQVTHTSATHGFMRMSERWTEADMKILSDNMSPAMAESLKDVVERMNPAQAAKLAEMLQKKLRTNSYADVNQVAGAVTALGALADFTGPDAAGIVKDAATSDRFSDTQANEALTLAAVRSLMRIGGSHSEGSESALTLLQESGWKTAPGLPMDKPEFRAELSDFVTGKKASSEISEEAKKVAYNTGFPQSVASLFRDNGVGAGVVEELTEKARANHTDAEIRSALSRVTLFNALPPQLRAEVPPELSGSDAPPETTPATTGDAASAPTGPGEIGVLQVIGQMANGTLEESGNNIVLTPLEKIVRDLRDRTALEVRETESEYGINANLSRQSLERLVELTSTGVSAWDHFASWFGGETLDNFIRDERLQIVDWEASSQRRAETGADLQAAKAKDEALTIALQTFDYQELRADGDERQADLLALRMLKEHGAALATMSPDVWKDLGMESPQILGELNSGLSANPQEAPRETVWQRLHRAGLVESVEPPNIALGTPDGLRQALEFLAQPLDPKMSDTAVRQAYALQAVDTDPALFAFTQVAMDLEGKLPELQQLVSAGLAGSRSLDFSNKVRTLVGAFEDTYKSMNTPDAKTGRTPLQDAEQSVALMRQELANADPSVRRQLSQRIEAMEKMLSFFDPNSQQGMNMQLLFDHVNSNDFNESGFLTWLAGDGIKTLGAIAGGVAAAALVAGTFGAATPFVVVLAASAAAGAAGGVIGYEATSETMYWAGTGERTGSQLGHWGRGGLVDGADGQARQLAGTDVLADYGKQFGYGFAISVATIGVGNLFGKALQGLSRTSAMQALRANSESFGRLAARVQQVEQAAAKVGGGPLANKWISEFTHEFGEELTEEALGQGAEVAIDKMLGDVNPVLGVVVSALIANRKMGGGFDLHPRPGDPSNINVEVSPGVDAMQTLSALQQQLRTDGMLVDWSGKPGDPMRIRTPEGGSIELRNAQDVEAGLPRSTLFSLGDTESSTTELDLTRFDLTNPTIEQIQERDTVDVWEPTEYSIQVRQKMQEWAQAMASGDYESALAIAESGELEPRNYDETTGQSTQPIASSATRVEVDFADLADVDSVQFRQVLSELNSPQNQSSHARRGPLEVIIDGRGNVVESRHEYSVRMADPVIKVPAGTEVVVDGESVTLEAAKEIRLFGSSEDLDPVSQALLTQIKESPAGQRMIAQQAMIAMEERLVHLSQHRNRDNIISPTLAQFLSDTTDLTAKPRQQGAAALLGLYGSQEPMPPAIAEMEVVGLLYDSGFSLQDIDSMLGRQHYEMRKPIYDWLKAREEAATATATANRSTDSGEQGDHPKPDGGGYPDTEQVSRPGTGEEKPAVQALLSQDVVLFAESPDQSSSGEFALRVFNPDGQDANSVLLFVDGALRPAPDHPPDRSQLTGIRKDENTTDMGGQTRFSYDSEGRVYEYKGGDTYQFRADMAVVSLERVTGVTRDGVDYDYHSRTDLEAPIQQSVSDFKEQLSADVPMSVDEFNSKMLDLMSQAPEVVFSVDQLISFNSDQQSFLTAFNDPIDAQDFARKNMNCMDCLAAVYHSMHDGKITTASDVKAKIRSNGERVGVNEPQRAETLLDAEKAQINWLVGATGIEPPTSMSRAMLEPHVESTGVRDFAVVVTFTRDGNSSGHVFYGRMQDDGSIMYYDPQSGVRWNPESVEPASPSYYPLKPGRSVPGDN